MKKVAILGTRGGICFAQNGFEKGLADIGSNTGNSLFQYAIETLVIDPKTGIDSSIDPQFVKDNFDVLVVPAANQLNEQWDLSHWADLIEKSDLPTVVVGLGAQARTQDVSSVNLQPGTVRFANIISERCKTIGVRGQFTQEVLARYGVHNSIVTGCPSQTINRQIDGQSIAQQINDIKMQGVSNAAYVVGTLEDYAREAEKRVSRLATQVPHVTVFQTDRRFLETIFEGRIADEDRNFLKWTKAFLKPSVSDETYFDYLLSHGRMYSGAQSWIDSMRRVDVTVGMRIHGCIAALMAGSLGVCVAFDSRTLELCQTMEIPYVTMDDLIGVPNFQVLLSQVKFDPAAFDAKKQKHYARIASILEESGITTSLN